MKNMNGHKEQKQGELQANSLEEVRERVEGMWQQAMSNRSSGREELAAAKANRAKAETERQLVANAALDVTKKTCDELIREAENRLANAKEAESKAGKKHTEAEKEWEQAKKESNEACSYRKKAVAEVEGYRETVTAEADSYNTKVRSEADAYRERVTAEAETCRETMLAGAQEETQRIRDEAREMADQECAELKRHVSQEIQTVLSEIDNMKQAAQEELEAQRIYTEAASLRTMTTDLQSQMMERVDKALAENEGSDTNDAPVEQDEIWEPGDVVKADVPVVVAMANGHQNGTPTNHKETKRQPRRSKKNKDI